MDTTPSSVYASKDYRRSRRAYCMECTFEYFVATMVAGSFLASLLSYIGLDDALIGVISSFISLAFLFQLASIFVVRHIVNTKRFVILFHILGQLLFGFLYVIPFLPFATRYKTVLVIVSIILAYFGNYLVTSMIYKWGNSFVEPHRRASFAATKEMISLISGVAVTLGTGILVDRFSARGQQEKGFIFIAIAIFIYCVSDFVCLMLIKNDRKDKEAKPEPPVPLRQVWKNTLCNRNYRHVVYLHMLWSVAQYTTLGFLGTYEINSHELAFSLGTIQLLTVLGTCSRALVSRPMGRYSDRHSYAIGMKLGFSVVACSFACLIFTSPATRYLIIGYIVLYNAGMAGINSNLSNITYHYVDSQYFVQATAIKGSVSGLCGFLASLLAGRLLSYVQANGNTLFGFSVYGQQVLGAISFVLTVIAILWVHFVVQKQKILDQAG